MKRRMKGSTKGNSLEELGRVRIDHYWQDQMLHTASVLGRY
jgi:hypothetical protein